ncbi:hypothetical protein ACHAXA_008646, partial [Cyclostephanos tholiformis]
GRGYSGYHRGGGVHHQGGGGGGGGGGGVCGCGGGRHNGPPGDGGGSGLGIGGSIGAPPGGGPRGGSPFDGGGEGNNNDNSNNGMPFRGGVGGGGGGGQNNNNNPFHYSRGGGGGNNNNNNNNAHRRGSSGPLGLGGGGGGGPPGGIGGLGGNNNNNNNNKNYRGGGGGGKFNNPPPMINPSSQKEREMLSIYGGGGMLGHYGGNPGNVGGGGGEGGGGGMGSSSFDSGSSPIRPSHPYGGVLNDAASVSSAIGPLENADNSVPPHSGMVKRKHVNPCRFVGHDHDWKDCPNNFRNKKKMKMMIGGRGGGGGGQQHGGGGGGGVGGVVGGGGGIPPSDPLQARRPPNNNNGGPMPMNHGGNNINNNGPVRGVGMMGGAMGAISVADHPGVIPGHYGPAVSLERGSSVGGRMVSSDIHRPRLDRGNTGGSVSSGIGGERGYDVYGSNTFAPSVPPSSSLLSGSRSRSFGEDSQQQQRGSGAGGRHNNNSGSPFLPKPDMVAERQRSRHRGGGGGVADALQQQQHQRGKAATNPHIPTHPGKPPHYQSHHPPSHDHYQPPPPSQQQQPKLPSPITSMKNERGYSFTTPSLISAVSSSLSGQLKRGFSSEGGGGGVGLERALVGDEQQGSDRDPIISPTPLWEIQPATPIEKSSTVAELRNHWVGGGEINPLSSSPGQILSAGRADGIGREEGEEGEEGEEEAEEADGDGALASVLSGTVAVTAPGMREEEEEVESNFAATRTSTGMSAIVAVPPSLSLRLSPPPLHGDAKSLSVDIAAPTTSPKGDSLYADLAPPSPWYAVRGPVATPASSPMHPPSSGEMSEGLAHTLSPKAIAGVRGRHDVDDSAGWPQNHIKSHARQQVSERTLHQPALAVDNIPAKGLIPLLLTSSRSNSSGAAVHATNESVVEEKDVEKGIEKGIEKEIEKDKDFPPLTCASLGDVDKIRKAEDIVAAMVKLADFNACLSGDGVGVPLPSKIQITKAMSVLELKIKLKMTEAMCVRKEVQAIQAAEKMKEERIAKMAAEEEKRIAMEEERLDKEAEECARMRRAKRNEIVSTRRRELIVIFEKRRTALQENRKTEISRMKKTQSDIEGGVVEVDSQIETLNSQLQEAEQQMAELDKAQLRSAATLPSGAKGCLAISKVLTDDETTNDGTDVPTFDYSGKMSGLVGRILAENQLIAKKAHLEVLEVIPFYPDAESTVGAKSRGVIPPCNDDAERTLISNKVWSNRARRVTGIHDALYTEPTEVPHYHENNENFIKIAPLIKDCIRRKNKKLKSRWTTLAEHYVLRQSMYNIQIGNTGDMSERGGYFSAAGFLLAGRGGEYYDAMNNVDSSTTSLPNIGNGCGGGSALQASAAGRGNNPYRRPRRGISPGDVVRSDYEQEQIIAEIAAKEAMEKRIKEGGCSLPRQRCWLENQLFASHTDGFFGKRVDDPFSDEEERRHVNIWSDMEKCIFLDRFLHHPKDFRKIASFLKNKSTKDCVKFYYNSKKTVPYKHALKEFIQRKNRRGDVVSWDATIQACLSMGAVVKAGCSPEKPLKFLLPEHDFTYHTWNFHPMRLEVFKNLMETVSHAKHLDDVKSSHAAKRKRSNWFILDAHEKKYLRHGDISEDHHSSKRKTSATAASITVCTAAAAVDSSSDDDDPKQENIKLKVKRIKNSKDGLDQEKQEEQRLNHKPQKWKEKEKEMFLTALEKYGHDWTAVSKAVGTRTPTQVKNYFYDNKKTIARQKDALEKTTKTIAKAVKGAALADDHDDAMEGKKKKKKKKGKKEASCATPSLVDTFKKLTPSSYETDSSRHGPASTENTEDSYSETVRREAGSDLTGQQACGQDREEQHRQYQLRLHNHQQQQLQFQQHLQLQQQQLERLVQQQQQEDMYRQHMQQEEIYRQHLRQQEMLLHQQHQHARQQNQPYAEPGQNWNQLDHRQLHNLQTMLSVRRSCQTPPMPQNYPMPSQQRGNYCSTEGGGPQKQLLNSSDLGHVYQTAVAAGIPSSALEVALAAAARGGGGQQLQQQHFFSRNESQRQAMSLELLRRLAMQHPHQGDGNWYGDDPYQR